jgi:CubicO group peptidase (beta-lactamase class C family)
MKSRSAAWLVALFLALSFGVQAKAFAEAPESIRYLSPKPGEFLRSWLVLAPLPIAPEAKEAPDNAVQKQAFARDFLTDAGGETGVAPLPGQKLTIAGKQLEWRLVKADADVVSFGTGPEAPAFAVAYAWAEIELPEAQSGLLGLGSDDAVKVWLNGRLVHENWAARAVEPDADLVPVRFERGVNRILLKVQNATGDWGFSCRLLGGTLLQARFVKAAGLGETEKLETILAAGASLDGRDERGLTALQSARIHGRKPAAELLLARGADGSLPTPSPEEVVDRTLGQIVKEGHPGVSVLVTKDGRVLLRRAYGLACVEHGVAATPETKYRIGSITKQFTAAAILKLQEQGKLSVGDKLSKFIPDFPRGDEVTLHHLLTHTSGIHSYTDKADFLTTVTVPTTPEELIRSFKNDPYDFSPGRNWRYDNSGYVLLGYIVEKASGQSYADFLAKTFFEPLGMKSTGVHNSRDIIPAEAYGYSWENGKLGKASNWDMSRAGGAGSLYSTLDDLNLWNEALFGGKVLSPASLDAALVPVVTTEDTDKSKDEGYGYGLAIGRTRGLRTVSHGGGLHGFRTHLLRVPDERFTVVVLSNSAPAVPGLEVGSLADEISELYLGSRMQDRVAPAVDASVTSAAYDDYLGQYDYGMAILTVTRQGDRLFAQLTGQPSFEIFPKAKDEFFWKVVEAEVRFVRDDAGRVVKALHRQGGQTITAPRFELPAVAKVDPKVYDDYVGKYDYGQGKAILAVTREGDRLFAQLTGQPKLEIFPKSSTEFFWKVVRAEVTFVRDASGKVTKAIHTQAGNRLEAPKIE